MDEEAKRPKRPELGSPEAAVLSCVTLMSMLFSQPEKDVAYYLDLYFQIRLAYERAKEARPEIPEPEAEEVQPGPEEEQGNGAADSQTSSECHTLPARQDAPPLRRARLF